MPFALSGYCLFSVGRHLRTLLTCTFRLTPAHFRITLYIPNIRTTFLILWKIWKYNTWTWIYLNDNNLMAKSVAIHYFALSLLCKPEHIFWIPRTKISLHFYRLFWPLVFVRLAIEYSCGISLLTLNLLYVLYVF